MAEPQLVPAPLDWVSLSSVLTSTGVRLADLCVLLEQGEVIGGQLASGGLLIDRSSLSAAVKILDVQAAADLARSTLPVGAMKNEELTLEQAATLAGVSPRTIRTAIRQGVLEASRKGSGSRAPYRLCHLAIMTWMNKKSPSSAKAFQVLSEKFITKKTTTAGNGKDARTRRRRFFE
jgi:hypothetical protein